MKWNGFGRAVATAALLAGAAALAAATYSVSGTTPLELSYSPTGTVEVTGSLTVTKPSAVLLRNFYIAFDESQSPQALGEALTYGIYSKSSSTTALSMSGHSSTNKMLKLKFASATSTSVTVSYVFRVSPTTFPGASSYTSIYTASLYLTLGTTPLATSSEITATTTVGKIAQVAVRSASTSSYAFTTASSDPNYALALGTLAAGTTGAARILARSNCGYEIFLSSANGGALVHSTDPSSSVPYSVSVNKGSAISLSSMSKIATGEATYSSPVTYDLGVRVLATSANPEAGSYSDTITVTVAAL